MISITLNRFGWINESAWHETFLAVAPDHPVPIGVFSVEHGDEFATLHAHVVLVASYERVQDDVPSGGILKSKKQIAKRTLEGKRNRLITLKKG